ncbi:hypothetical protein BGX29_006601 [Mortierella sp. GBA35]|nr:hypothetical protein BGX29_006601 [Mortierella sp. GBA35]
MTTVGTLSTDLGPGNNNLSQSGMDLPTAPNNAIPLIVTTSADDDKAVLARANNDNPMNYLQPVNKLDMEPNPFEQSFSDLSPETSGPPSGNSAPAPEAPKPTLPPIASMSGRLAPANEQYGWEAQSLRMGPLSPSMLEGPQDPIPVGSYPATTAAISTIYTSGAPMAENGYPYVGMAGSIAPSAGPIQTAEPYPPAIYNQAAQAPRQPQAFPHISGQAPMNDRYIPPQGAPHPDNVHAYNNMHNLSQSQAAQQREMWVKRESIDANGYFPGQPQHQQQQQQHHVAQNGQTASRPTRLTSEDNSDDSQFSRQSSVSGDLRSGKDSIANANGNKKRPASEDKMDEEEKRKNFLERNRQAALKCRQRKKQWLSNLQAKVEYLTTDNEHLQTQTAALRDEIIHLKALLLAHKDCPVAQANGVYAHTIGVANNHSGMMPPNMQGQAGQQQQRGVPQRGPMPQQPPQQMQAGGARVTISSASGGAAVSAATSQGQGQAMRY